MVTIESAQVVDKIMTLNINRDKFALPYKEITESSLLAMFNYSNATGCTSQFQLSLKTVEGADWSQPKKVSLSSGNSLLITVTESWLETVRLYYGVANVQPSSINSSYVEMNIKVYSEAKLLLDNLTIS